MKKAVQHLVHNLGYTLSILLFILAVFIIHHKIRQYHYHDIVNQVLQTPSVYLISAMLLTCLNYLVLTCYDALALHYIKAPLKYHRIMIASFIGYVFSMNATVLGGGAARYRIYSSFGVSAANVARLIIFSSITFWLGYLTTGAFSFLFHPQPIPNIPHFPFLSVRPVGVIFLTILLVYFSMVLFIRKPLKIRDWKLTPPGWRLTLVQTLISSVDWLIAAGVLYTLMPKSLGLTYSSFLGIFLLAQVTGLISMVPGGLGVFETAILLLLSDYGEPTALLGSLLLYRVIYYLLPLTAASVLLGTSEFLFQKHLVNRVSRFLGRFGRSVIPQLFAFTTFAAGTILLFSGTLPAVKGRMTLLRDFLPLPAIEISHFLGSIAGTGLIVLAHSLQRRINAAYHVTVTLLIAGIVFSLLKGLDYEEATILTVMLLSIVPCRKAFYRKASLFDHAFSPGWILSIVAVIACSIWLGMFSYKHVEYSHRLWWRFAFNADAPRFLRATAAGIVVFLVYFWAKLQFPVKRITAQTDADQLSTAERIVRTSPDSYSWLALLGDKHFLFDESQRAFIMYAVQGRSWIALGEPVGPVDKRQDLLWDFTELCDRYDGWPVFYQVDEENRDIYLDMGLAFLKLGEEARVDLDAFSLSGAARSGLRYSCNKLRKQQCCFSVVEPPEVPGILPQLQEVSDQWLKEKKTREKKFSLGCFDPAYLAKFPIGIVRQDNTILAFANILAGAGNDEISVDLMRFLPDGPVGMMDYLFIEIMLWAKEQGIKWFNFGMAPLSGIEDRSLAPLWSYAGTFIFEHGEFFYNFKGLRQYKAKFDPHWKPKYLACPGGLVLPRILANTAVLISGGLEGVIRK